MIAGADPDRLDRHARATLRRRWVRRVVGTYAGVSALWILTSDLVVELLAPERGSTQTAVSMIKGWAFVLATATMLAVWLVRYARDIDESADEITALHQRTIDSERRWILALETSGQGVWDWDAVSNIGFRSPGWSTMLGYRDGDIDPDPDGWLDLVHPDDQRRALDANADTLRAGHDRSSSEHRMRRADGSYCWVLDRSTVVERFEDGRPKRVIGVQLDISHQREAIAELDAHRMRLADLVIERTLELEVANRSLLAQIEEVADLYNNAPCGYHSLGPDGTVQAMNDTELRWLGYDRHEVVGHPMQHLLTPKSRDDFSEMFPRFIEGGTVADVDLEFMRRDGSVLPIVLSSTAIRDVHGTFIGSRSTVFDNRERRARERHVALLNAELAKRAEDAEQASRAKSNFLATMSHEMRTPLNAIVGFSHVLEREVSDPAVKDRLRKVHSAAGHLAEIINDVLDLSKIESGNLKLQAVAFSPSALIDEAASLVAGQADARSIIVSTAIDAGVPDAVRGDPTRFEQAVVNYLSNAVKFTNGPRVRIQVKRLRTTDDRIGLRVEVVDEGPGIAPDDLRRLFTRFEQGDASTTRRHGGTGLGLVITRQLAQAMGGDAGAISTLGIGSTFWFEAMFDAEVAGAARDAHDLPDVEIADLAWDAQVLVVEDNELNQEVVCDLLAQLGIAADIAGSGAEALGMVADKPYQLVLMDIQMPEMDGFEATRLLRHCPVYNQVPIVAMTAGVFTSDREGSADAGMDDHLTKPIDPRQLSRVLHRWLPAHTRRSASRVRPRALGGSAPGRLPDQTGDRVLDVVTGLSYCSGRDDVYVSRLTRWVHDNVPLAERLCSTDTLSSAEQLRGAIHLLVASSGYLGARELSELARSFEQLIIDASIGSTVSADDGSIARTAAALANAISLVASRAATLFPASALDHDPFAANDGDGESAHRSISDHRDDAIAVASAVSDALVHRRATMQHLLRSDDATSSHYLDAHYRDLADTFAGDHPAFAEFVEHVHRFDFPAALETLERANSDQIVRPAESDGLASTNVLSPPASVRTSDHPD